MPAAILARLVLLEARRSALPWLAAASIAAALILAAFLSSVALTEGRELRLAVVAALLRACAVFLVILHVAASVQREIDDKGLEQMLSLPLPRAVHYLGRLAGFALCGALLALVFAAPLALWAAPAPLAYWTLSLACECALVAAAALFFSMGLGQIVGAVSASVALYVLGRAVAAVQAIAAGPLAAESLPGRLAAHVVDALAFVLPRLDAVTRTDWLLYGAPQGGDYAWGLAGLLAYALLVTAAGLVDFYRRAP
ncbi:MAG TPA: ABC transporter permease [Burkholderiales bacterium]|nr:ABC transporter permease [Burkholderiales bacterium]